jgi:stage V sporulation protein B
MVFPVMMFPAAIVYSLCDLLIPEMARCYASQRFSRIRYLGGKSLKIVFLYSLIFSGLFSLLAGPVCMWLYQSSEAGMHLGRYALLIPMLYCDAIIDAMNKGLGQQKICVRYNILTAAMDILFLFLLLPRYGMMGYFISFLVTHLLNFLLSLRKLLKITHISLSPGAAVLVPVATASAVFLASHIYSPIARGVGFVLLFGSLLVLFRVLGKEDLFWLKGLTAKK